jgi:hypothetical protein
MDIVELSIDKIMGPQYLYIITIVEKYVFYKFIDESEQINSLIAKKHYLKNHSYRKILLIFSIVPCVFKI